MRKTILGVTISVLGALLVPAPAFAADTEEIAAALVDEALALYGVETDDDTLVADLEASLELAVEQSVIDEELLVLTEELIDSGESTSVISDALVDNQAEQDELWVAQGDVITNAFTNVAQLFDQCRDSQEPCELDYALEFRASWAESETARLAELEAQLDSLSGQAKVAAEERLAARLEKLEAVVAGETPSSSNAKNDKGEEQSEQKPNGNSGNSNSSNGNSGSKAPASSDSGETASPTDDGADDSPGNSGSRPGKSSDSTDSPGNSDGKGNSGGSSKGNGKS